MEGFDVSAVREKAQSLLLKHKNVPDEAKTHYLATILDWSDYYTEVFSDINSEDAKKFVNSLSDLWISLAKMLTVLRQYKQVVQVYEDALKDPIVSRCAKIYSAYAGYFKERDKLPSAQKVFIRGLSAKLEQSQVDEVWKEFLTILQSGPSSDGMEELTLSQLVAAVSEQVEDTASLSSPSDSILDFTSIVPVIPQTLVEDIKTDIPIEHENPMDTSNNIDVGVSEMKEEMATPVEVEDEEYEESDEEQDSGDVATPLELLTTHQKKPPLLFASPGTNTLSHGLSNLSSTELDELQGFFGTSLLDYKPSEDDNVKIERILDLLEAMWIAQAMHEKSFNEWFDVMRGLHHRERDTMQREWSVREARIGREAAVVRNQGDTNRFLNRCAVQTDLLFAEINRTLHTLVCEQLRVLVLTGLPFLTKQLSKSMDQSKGNYDIDIQQQMEVARRVVNALLSLRTLSSPASLKRKDLEEDIHPHMSSLPVSSAPVAISNTPASRILLHTPIDLIKVEARGKKKKRRRLASGPASPKDLSKYGPGLLVDTAPDLKPISNFGGPQPATDLLKYGPGMPSVQEVPYARYGPPVRHMDSYSGFDSNPRQHMEPHIYGPVIVSGYNMPPYEEPMMNPYSIAQSMQVTGPLNPFPQTLRVLPTVAPVIAPALAPVLVPNQGSGTSTANAKAIDKDKAKLPLLQKLALMMKSAKK